MTNRRIALTTLALVVAVHVAIVISIARQPLHVRTAPPAERAVIFPLHHDTVHRAGPAGDFFAIYHAGIKVSRGESPYDNKETPRVTPEFFPFRYLPVVAQTVGAAVITVPPQTAHRAWIVVLELLLLVAAGLLWRELRSDEWRVAVIAPLLLASPYFLELHMGQFTFATSVLLAMGLLFLDRGSKKSLAGGTLAFAVAVLLKVFPLVAGAALLRYRRGFIAGAITAALVVAISLPYFLGHEADWRSFAKTNFGDTKTEGFHGGNYGFLYVLFLFAKDTGGHPAVLKFLEFAAIWQIAILGVTAALVLWRKPTMLTGGLVLAFAHMSSYKHVWEHHASGAVVLAAFLLIRMNQDRPWWGRWVVLGCLLILALPTPFYFVDALDPRVYDPTNSWSKLGRYLLPMCKAIPMLVCWMIGCVQVFRERGRLAT
ncbi:MAG: DUF2029 domain-containing protein [Deltaproteobacteria bacterium]|nr:DUF2029 domain-containing protein [Deltaproteobacteria bacterium]